MLLNITIRLLFPDHFNTVVPTASAAKIYNPERNNGHLILFKFLQANLLIIPYMMLYANIYQQGSCKDRYLVSYTWW